MLKYIAVYVCQINFTVFNSKLVTIFHCFCSEELFLLNVFNTNVDYFLKAALIHTNNNIHCSGIFNVPYRCKYTLDHASNIIMANILFYTYKHYRPNVVQVPVVVKQGRGEDDKYYKLYINKVIDEFGEKK